MRSTVTCFIISIVIGGLLVSCSVKMETGDYILGKEIKDDIHEIFVVHNISEKESKTKSLSDFLLNKDKNDVTIYHIKDTDLYNDLNIGERVTVESRGYTMLSLPPQAVAHEIIRHSIAK